MSTFKSFIILSTVTCLALYANTPSDDLVQKEKATQSAVLAIISNFLLTNTPNISATFDGDIIGSVTEDTTFTTDGTLDVSDPDENQESMQMGTYTGTYGSLTMDRAGEWTYTLDNNNATVQALDDGETVSDIVTVRSLDGTAQIITITVNGKNEAPIDTLPSYNLTIIDLGSASALNGEVTDINNGVSKVVISYSDGTPNEIYASGVISTGAHLKGETATLSVTDGDGNVAPDKIFTF